MQSARGKCTLHLGCHADAIVKYVFVLIVVILEDLGCWLFKLMMTVVLEQFGC